MTHKTRGPNDEPDAHPSTQQTHCQTLQRHVLEHAAETVLEGLLVGEDHLAALWQRAEAVVQLDQEVLLVQGNQRWLDATHEPTCGNRPRSNVPPLLVTSEGASMRVALRFRDLALHPLPKQRANRPPALAASLSPGGAP